MKNGIKSGVVSYDDDVNRMSIVENQVKNYEYQDNSDRKNH